MAQIRKYANLPDLDNAPDIYETPELTDDNTSSTTVQTFSAARSSSPTASEASQDGHTSGVNRRRLDPDQARNHFLRSRVDARDADFSDRVNGRKSSYRIYSRRQRRRQGRGVIEREGGDGDDGHDEHDSQESWSEEDGEEEGLERRLARLQREVEEVRAAFAAQGRGTDQEGEGEGDGDEDGGAEGDRVEATGKKSEVDGGSKGLSSVEELSKALDTIRKSRQDALSAHAQLSNQLSTPFTAAAKTDDKEAKSTKATAAPSATASTTTAVDSQRTLSQIASFDTRLSSLERSLGLNALDPSNASTATVTPILPTLTMLDTQLSALTSSDSYPHLEALLQRAATASSSIAHTTDGQQATTSTTRAPGASAGTTAGAGATETNLSLSQEDISKLRGLYATLPTISSLAPTLPPLLSRLRSLRTLHAGAAGAASTLDDIQKRQAEQAREIEVWKTGLEKVEEAVREAERGLNVNVGVVEGWVKDLEARVKRRA